MQLNLHAQIEHDSEMQKWMTNNREQIEIYKFKLKYTKTNMKNWNTIYIWKIIYRTLVFDADIASANIGVKKRRNGNAPPGLGNEGDRKSHRRMVVVTTMAKLEGRVYFGPENEDRRAP